MAIDSAEKRRSAAGVAFLPLGPGVTPNASKDQEWRQQAAWSYSGILAGAGVDEPDSIFFTSITGSLPTFDSITASLPTFENIAIAESP